MLYTIFTKNMFIAKETSLVHKYLTNNKELDILNCLLNFDAECDKCKLLFI